MISSASVSNLYMGNWRGWAASVAAIVLTIALTVWDIHNWNIIGKMGMAWDTGAPVWPYQAPDILLRLMNFPAYVIGVPLSNLLGLTAPKYHLLVLPIAIAFWILVGTVFHIRRRKQSSRTLWRCCMVLLATVVLLSCASAVLWDSYRWWSIYGHSAARSWLVLLRLETPALWCIMAACALSLRVFSPRPT